MKTLKKICPLLILAVLIFADQMTKQLAVTHLKGQADYPLFPGILEFSYLENTGAAFSSFMGRQGFLILLTICVMCLFTWKYFQIPNNRHYMPMRVTFILIVCGGVGNLIDRILNGYVVDFIYFVPINFPTFNVADCYVSAGMVLLVFLCFFYYKESDLDFLFRFKK